MTDLPKPYVPEAYVYLLADFAIDGPAKGMPTGDYKIGWTVDLKKRHGYWSQHTGRRGLQLVAWVCIVGDDCKDSAHTLERFIHKRFRRIRFGKGEWFKFHEYGAGVGFESLITEVFLGAAYYSMYRIESLHINTSLPYAAKIHSGLTSKLPIWASHRSEAYDVAVHLPVGGYLNVCKAGQGLPFNVCQYPLYPPQYDEPTLVPDHYEYLECLDLILRSEGEIVLRMAVELMREMGMAFADSAAEMAEVIIQEEIAS